MNIAENISFNADKPAILSVLKTESVNLFAVGLLKNQMLKKHNTVIPSLLTVLKGSLEFRIGNDKIIFRQFDTYAIPLNIEHEVEGVDEENVFTILQEK